ncbi:hypothetical protein [Saccharothrix syringae]|uniref:Uncharacterized protein n=1 Tax=Saccharothrix syringae TaxID=103733 RepID=A0A5Q0HD34_SACSY|nr:hypothetical protein [Saccharothrix syringae]QFZ23740.1 hypothetical protein EKG83_45505 [Saccharothrix syringae]
MDEQKLAELFRDAARDAPPASFDVAGVRSASARADARRRSTIALGATLAAVLLVGGGVAATLAPDTASDTAAAGSAEGGSSPNVTPFGTPEAADVAPEDAAPGRTGGPPPKSLPEDTPTQGGEPSGSAGRSTTGSTPPGCVEVDRELADALASELPVARDLIPAPAAARCPAGARGASFLLRDGAVTGTVSVVLTPAGALPPSFDEGTLSETAAASGGRELHVLATPAAGAGEVPFAGELPSLAQRLAERF